MYTSKVSYKKILYYLYHSITNKKLSYIAFTNGQIIIYYDIWPMRMIYY